MSTTLGKVDEPLGDRITRLGLFSEERWKLRNHLMEIFKTRNVLYG